MLKTKKSKASLDLKTSFDLYNTILRLSCDPQSENAIYYGSINEIDKTFTKSNN